MKKILLSLLVGFIGIISFCSADLIGKAICNTYNFQICDGGTIYAPVCSGTYDIYLQSDYKFAVKYYKSDGTVSAKNQLTSTGLTFDCSIEKIEIYSPPGFVSPAPSFPYYVEFGTFGNGGSCPTCPEVDTGAILSGYVPESQLTSCQSDLSSCQSSLSGVQSDLSSCQSFTSGFNEQLNYCNSELVSCNSSLTSCLQYNCPETELSYSKFYVRHGESTWSQLTGTENYYVYLPEYLGYNYEYSNGTDLDFTVGVATDTGYINNINAIQNSKPSQEDLNKLISEVIPLFVPGLAVILLLYFIFRFIKKVF